MNRCARNCPARVSAASHCGLSGSLASTISIRPSRTNSSTSCRGGSVRSVRPPLPDQRSASLARAHSSRLYIAPNTSLCPKGRSTAAAASIAGSPCTRLVWRQLDPWQRLEALGGVHSVEHRMVHAIEYGPLIGPVYAHGHGRILIDHGLERLVDDQSKLVVVEPLEKCFNPHLQAAHGHGKSPQIPGGRCQSVQRGAMARPLGARQRWRAG